MIHRKAPSALDAAELRLLTVSAGMLFGALCPGVNARQSHHCVFLGFPARSLGIPSLIKPGDDVTPYELILPSFKQELKFFSFPGIGDAVAHMAGRDQRAFLSDCGHALFVSKAGLAARLPTWPRVDRSRGIQHRHIYLIRNSEMAGDQLPLLTPGIGRPQMPWSFRPDLPRRWATTSRWTRFTFGSSP